jgi:hypothetical protein
MNVPTERRFVTLVRKKFNMGVEAYFRKRGKAKLATMAREIGVSISTVHRHYLKWVLDGFQHRKGSR